MAQFAGCVLLTWHKADRPASLCRWDFKARHFDAVMLFKMVRRCGISITS